MPNKPKRPCNHPRCRELVSGGSYCDKHKRDRHRRYNAEDRPQDHNYYGTARWKKLRAMQLAREPLCRMCREQGKRTIATVADHIKPRDKGGEDSLDNLQSLCQSCHSKKSMLERGRG